MKKSLVLFTVFIATIITYSCSNNSTKEEEIVIETAAYSSNLSSDNGAKELLETKCNICHSIKSSEDAMIAPPFTNIQKKYKRVYASKQEFVDAIVDFNAEPTKDKAMMFGALKKFGVMAKMPYSKDDVEKIANYMYNAEFESPSWCKH